MELQVHEFEVTKTGLKHRDWYLISIRPDMQLLGLALEEYLSRVAASEYHEKVMAWFNDCDKTGVISEFNISNGGSVSAVQVFVGASASTRNLAAKRAFTSQ